MNTFSRAGRLCAAAGFGLVVVTTLAAQPAATSPWAKVVALPRIPYYEKIDEAKTANYAMMNTPAESYESTAAIEAAEDYTKLAWKVFEGRMAGPRCPGGECRM